MQNPASGDALTKLQDDVDETKIVLVRGRFPSMFNCYMQVFVIKLHVECRSCILSGSKKPLQIERETNCQFVQEFI